ncbi:unnamed protein product, partial [Mesorhabditis spiculigera]
MAGINMQDFSCVVCLEDFSDLRRPTILMPCGHTVVCQLCLAQSLNKCPICRSHYVSHQINYELENALNERRQLIETSRNFAEQLQMITDAAFNNQVTALKLESGVEFQQQQLAEMKKKLEESGKQETSSLIAELRQMLLEKPEQKKNGVYLTGLPAEWTDNEVKAMAALVVPEEEARIKPYEPRSAGRCVVTFATEESATKFINSCNGTLYLGKPDNRITAKYATYRRTENKPIDPKPSAPVSRNSARPMVHVQTPYRAPPQRNPQEQQSINQRKLYFWNLPKDVKSDDVVRALFEPAGHQELVQLEKRS